MKFILSFCAILGACCQYVQAKAVFAHFMVSNSLNFTIADWQRNFLLAKESKLDGFALNVGRGDPSNGQPLTDAFDSAAANGFKLFLNFDYASGGLWPVDSVVSLILKFSASPAYYKHNGKPLVSTFEGSTASGDWKNIKDQTKCFFVPSWSSLSPSQALSKDVADGLSSWEAWPTGPSDMFSTLDSTYKIALGSRPYMMPVSPWFFANMPGFNKNWVWRGESLWFDRWNHIFYHQPEFVQIISWNDFGESHYIGPLDTKQYAAFGANYGKSPYIYAAGVPHDGWRRFLPFVIDMYKNGVATVTNEGLVSWYRQSSAVLSVCSNGGTTGNTAAKLQNLYGPSQILQDRVYFSALLGSAADVTVSIGSVPVTAGWENVPVGGVGIYHGSVNFAGKNGTVVVSILRGTSVVLRMTGQPIRTTCPNSIQNYNPYVGSVGASAVISKTTAGPAVCVDGTGPGSYFGLCQFACRLDYCPPVCTCTMVGPARTRPAALGQHACPAPGLDNTFEGLCSFNCDRGYCSPSACVKKPVGTVCNAPNPVDPIPNVCKRGTASTPYTSLCEFSCQYGVCPPEICTCTLASQPPAPAAPPSTGVTGSPLEGFPYDWGLCAWDCARGVCPTEICKSSAGKREIGGEEIKRHGHAAFHQHGSLS